VAEQVDLDLIPDHHCRRWVRGARGIPTYLDMPVSTIEKLVGRRELPVHRPMGTGGPILASTAELDEWAASGEM
jgi:hypothetical protein